MSFTRFKCADDDIIACGRPSPSPANADDVSDDAGEPLRRTDRANDALFFAPNPAPPERCDAGFVENLLGVTVSVARRSSSTGRPPPPRPFPTARVDVDVDADARVVERGVVSPPPPPRRTNALIGRVVDRTSPAVVSSRTNALDGRGFPPRARNVPRAGSLSLGAPPVSPPRDRQRVESPLCDSLASRSARAIPYLPTPPPLPPPPRETSASTSATTTASFALAAKCAPRHSPRRPLELRPARAACDVLFRANPPSFRDAGAVVGRAVCEVYARSDTATWTWRFARASISTPSSRASLTYAASDAEDSESLAVDGRREKLDLDADSDDRRPLAKPSPVSPGPKRFTRYTVAPAVVGRSYASAKARAARSVG